MFTHLPPAFVTNFQRNNWPMREWQPNLNCLLESFFLHYTGNGTSMQALNKKTFRLSDPGKPLHLHWLLHEIPKDSKSGRMERTV
jgi:exonuclease V gamma subunit